MRFFLRYRAAIVLGVLAAAFTLVLVDYAEARRGGSFGSRGFRTQDRPAPTRTAPNETRPVDRSMTPRQQNQQGQPGAQQQRPGTQQAGAQRGMFGGMMGGLLGGLMLGGLIGMLLGNGLGGLAGFLGLLLQVGVIVLGVMLIMRLVRGRRGAPAMAGGAPDGSRNDFSGTDAGRSAMGPSGQTGGAPGAPAAGGMMPGGGLGSMLPAGLGGGRKTPHAENTDEIGITAEDLDAFEQLLVEIQAAFTREDYAALRERSTPEIVSFLSEELSQNAVDGVRNEVLSVQLLQGDLAEASREYDEEYATVAMRYESIDVLRDRQSGDLVEGDNEPTETVEIWTFVRQQGGRWKLSAIQEAD